MTQPPCDNCKRPPWFDRPLHSIGGGQKVCTDCFCFFSGIDPRDPAHERTARSGDDLYMTKDEWMAAGKPSVPVEEEAQPAFTVGEFGNTFRCTKEEGWTVNGEPYNPDEDGVHQPERPPLAPLPPGTPWWARLLHWLGLRMVNER